MQGTFHAVNASFSSTNPLNDPSISSIAAVTVNDLEHVVFLTGQAMLCNISSSLLARVLG